MKRCGKTMLSFSRQFNVEYTWCVCRVLCSFNFITWSSRITVLHPLFTVAILPTVKNLCQNYFFKKQYLCDKVFAMLIHFTKNPYRYRKFKNICYWNCCRAGWMNTAQKIKFSIKDFFSGSVGVAKSAVVCRFGQICWRNPWREGAYGLFLMSRARCARLAFRGLSCWEALVTLYLWFPF